MITIRSSNVLVWRLVRTSPSFMVENALPTLPFVNGRLTQQDYIGPLSYIIFSINIFQFILNGKNGCSSGPLNTSRKYSAAGLVIIISIFIRSIRTGVNTSIKKNNDGTKQLLHPRFEGLLGNVVSMYFNRQHCVGILQQCFPELLSVILDKTNFTVDHSFDFREPDVLDPLNNIHFHLT